MNKLTRTVFRSDILSQSARRLIFGTKGTLDARAFLDREFLEGFVLQAFGSRGSRAKLERLTPDCIEP